MLMDETIDLSEFRARGKQPGEVLLPDTPSDNVERPATEVNERFVETVHGLGLISSHYLSTFSFTLTTLGHQSSFLFTGWLVREICAPGILFFKLLPRRW